MSRPAFYETKRVECKSSAQDLVTETDRGVEELIRKLVAEKYPQHQYK